ncbi:MAG: heat-inducible transcriptional repressor HrcA [Lachnospiraceae bacterium]|nr:heat-inducible transcriptional repressor HrcA [Lachnospiraceae bacterium]
MKILQAIIRNYLETGEPVGSRTISKYTDLNLSSATIRNEMSDLEEMGYIVQPHTSAGRIPTDRGYRLYVDSMMEENARQVEELKEMLVEKDEKMDHLLKQVAKVLAVNTNYATMVTAPRTSGNKVKFIQLSRVSDEQILVVVVAEGNIIKNTIISVSEPIDDETMLKLNILLNTSLNGLAIDEINLALISKMKTQAGEYGAFIGDVIDAVAETIKDDDDLEVYTSGANNIFKYPELANEENASGLINAFEEKQILAQLAEYNSDESETKNGIRVYIGEESPISGIKDCSIVTASYEFGDGMKGTIGIIGPKRMDYEKVVGTLQTIKGQLDAMYSEDKK